MESRQSRYNLRSLPGGRRGASGADAGCLSMRTIGSGELNRRASASSTSSEEVRVGVTADRCESGSLPGGRRGAPGADAGCSSMRSVGRKKVRSRAYSSPVQEGVVSEQREITTSPTTNESLFDSPESSLQSFARRRRSRSTTTSVTSEDVVQEASATIPAPANDDPRARRKWTIEMNELIWRTYLEITNNETTTKGYLGQLHQVFTEKFPQMNASRQSVGVQRRVIIKNRLLTTSRLEEIRQEVLASHINISHNQHNIIHHTQHDSTSQTRIRWTDEVNEAIMREYYRLTQLESNTTAYREQLHSVITRQFPHIAHVSKQRIADQRRAIVENRYLGEEKLQEIRQEIERELGSETEIRDEFTNVLEDPNNLLTTLTLHDQTECTPVDLSHTNETHINRRSRINQFVSDEALDDRIINTYHDTYRKFENSDPTTRPSIPKQSTSKKLSYIVHKLNNDILPNYLNEDNSFNVTQTIVYSAAYTAALCNGSKIKDINSEQSPRPVDQPWQRRLKCKIENLRKDIARMNQYRTGIRSRALIAHIDKIKHKYRTHSRYEEQNLTDEQFLDTLKQKLTIATSRLRRYNNCTLRKKQNHCFKVNEKSFYRNLASQTAAQQTTNTSNTPLPTPESMHSFWSGIWSNPVQHEQNADWIREDLQQPEMINEMQFELIPGNIFKEVIKNLHNWKAPGTDNIHNYWYKKFTVLHPQLYKHVNEFIKSPDTMPDYITQGITYMIPKGNDQLNPANYRPITCLQTIYKIITSCISLIVTDHIEQNNILAEEQKGCRKNSQGCKEQLIIDSIAMKHTALNKKDLHTMYIDYRKAYDSVPHSWLIYVLNRYKIHPDITQFLHNAMMLWRTKLTIRTNNGSIQTENIPIKRGIFQGDALSPLWFCLALNPLSEMLNKSNLGLEINTQENDRHSLTHLMYMDDIKLYSNSKVSLHHLADITQTFSNDISMQFGIDKCKTFAIEKGAVTLHPYTLTSGEIVEPMDQNSFYKYLGFQQTQQIAHRETKLDIKRKFKYRLNAVLKSQLNSRNLIKAINTYVIPVLTYTFGIINWSQTDLKKLQRTINTTLTAHRKHHPRSCIQRLTLPRNEGGRSLIDIVNLHNKQITNIKTFFIKRAENSTLHRTIVATDIKITPLNLHNTNKQYNERTVDRNEKLAAWERKSLHGRHYRDLQMSHVDKTASNAWLQQGELFPETEAFMLAIQDQVIDTRNYQKYIIRAPNISDTCRRCHSNSETIQHITGACKAIVQTDYKHRHDQVSAIIHQLLAHKYKLVTETVPYYKYKPEAVLENQNYKMYWDRTIMTDKTVHYNRPDITVLDKVNKSAYLIDIGICNTHNLQTTHNEKIAKYIDLSIEIKTQWKINNTKTVPIILSTTGVIPKTLHTNIQALNLPSYTYKQLQKAVILNTCRIVRKFLNFT